MSDGQDDCVADSWEDGDDKIEEQLQHKVQQVRILKRAEEEKKERQKERDERLAKDTLQSLNIGCPTSSFDASSAKTGGGGVAVKLLRRPASGSALDGRAAASASAQHADAEPQAALDTDDKQAKPLQKSLEERQADYDAARARILGSDYKPDPAAVNLPTTTSRSRSPEQIRLTPSVNRPATQPSTTGSSLPLMSQPPPHVYQQQQQYIPESGPVLYYSSSCHLDSGSMSCPPPFHTDSGSAFFVSSGAPTAPHPPSLFEMSVDMSRPPPTLPPSAAMFAAAAAAQHQRNASLVSGQPTTAGGAYYMNQQFAAPLQHMQQQPIDHTSTYGRPPGHILPPYAMNPSVTVRHISYAAPGNATSKK